jgi:DNA-binding response OmpR family regulator
MAVPEPTRALIVEDDPVVGRSIARRLLREGYTVSVAQTCRAARAAGSGFQVGVLDLET